MENKKYKLGISLSGGGAKGFAHLGVMQALYDNGIFPDIIAGTSAGALAGVLIADGHEPKEVVSFFEKKAFKQFAQITMPKCGFFHTKPFYVFLEKYLHARTFEELKIPMVVVATDIENGKSHTFSSGPLLQTIVASCAFPVVFTPVEIDGKHFVDGGLFKNFPVSPIRKQCEHIIGVNVSPLNQVDYRESLKYIIERSYHYLSISNTFLDRQLCDVLVELGNLNDYPMFDLEHPREIYEHGYEFMVKYMDENQHMLESFVVKTEV